MRKPLLLIIAPAFLLSFFYTAFGFASLEFNPFHWSGFLRFIFATIAGAFIVITDLFILFGIKESDLHGTE